ncbi:MAG TPA: MFS transporter, partial [Acidimicrobiales bacterium]
TIAVAATLAGRDADPKVFATMLLAQVGPAAVTGALGGPLVDRLPRKTVMILSDLFRGLAVASLFLVSEPSMTQFYLVAAALGFLGALSQPALHASLPNVVETDQLVAANALVSATFNGAVMVGPVIGGVLVARLGFAPAIFINGISFLASAVLVSRVHLPPQPPSEGDWHPVTELREGFRHVLTTPLVRGVIAVMGLVMLAAAVKSPIEPLFVLNVLHGSPDMLGFIGGAWGVGMVVGSIIAPAAARAWKREHLLWAGVAVVGMSVVAAAQAGAIAPVLVLWLVAGAGNALGTVCYESLLQERTPDALRGRVFAASEAVLDTAFLGGVALAAWMGTHLGSRNALTVAGSAFLLAALLSRVLLTRRAAPLFSVAQPWVDEADELLARGEAPYVLTYPGGHEGPGHLGGVGGVRGDQAVRHVPEWVALGERLGFGDIERRPGQPLLLLATDEVVGDDVPASGHVDEPGVGLHGPELGLGDDPFGLGREGEGQDDDVRRVHRLFQAVPADGPCPTCEWLGLSADDCCLDVERAEQAKQRLRDAARAEDGDGGTEEGAAAASVPSAGERALVQVP